MLGTARYLIYSILRQVRCSSCAYMLYVVSFTSYFRVNTAQRKRPYIYYRQFPSGTGLGEWGKTDLKIIKHASDSWLWAIPPILAE